MRGLSDRLIAGYLDDLVRAIRTVFSAAWEAHGELHFWRGVAVCFSVMVALQLAAVIAGLTAAFFLRRWSKPR